jgi:hypothetical protein
LFFVVKRGHWRSARSEMDEARAAKRIGITANRTCSTKVLDRATRVTANHIGVHDLWVGTSASGSPKKRHRCLRGPSAPPTGLTGYFGAPQQVLGV